MFYFWAQKKKTSIIKGIRTFFLIEFNRGSLNRRFHPFGEILLIPNLIHSSVKKHLSLVAFNVQANFKSLLIHQFYRNLCNFIKNLNYFYVWIISNERIEPYPTLSSIFLKCGLNLHPAVFKKEFRWIVGPLPNWYLLSWA